MKLNTNLENFRELIARPSELQIAVYGKYNHGKSSLLNALIKEEVFKTADKRETVTIQKLTKDNITWIDTPGLDADIAEIDDTQAEEILNKSDLLLFVHSVNEGELDEKELRFLKEQYEVQNNILLILTQIDKTETLENVQQVIESQLGYMINKIQVISVSSKRVSHKNENIRKRSNIESIWNIISKEKRTILSLRNTKKDKLKLEIEETVKEKIKKLKNKRVSLYEEKNEIINEFEEDIQAIRYL